MPNSPNRAVELIHYNNVVDDSNKKITSASKKSTTAKLTFLEHKKEFDKLLAKANVYYKEFKSLTQRTVADSQNVLEHLEDLGASLRETKRAIHKEAGKISNSSRIIGAQLILQEEIAVEGVSKPNEVPNFTTFEEMAEVDTLLKEVEKEYSDFIRMCEVFRTNPRSPKVSIQGEPSDLDVKPPSRHRNNKRCPCSLQKLTAVICCLIITIIVTSVLLSLFIRRNPRSAR